MPSVKVSEEAGAVGVGGGAECSLAATFLCAAGAHHGVGGSDRLLVSIDRFPDERGALVAEGAADEFGNSAAEEGCVLAG